MSRRGQLEESIPPYVEIIDNKGWWNVSKWFPPPPATLLKKQTTPMQEEIPF